MRKRSTLFGRVMRKNRVVPAGHTTPNKPRLPMSALRALSHSEGEVLTLALRRLREQGDDKEAQQAEEQ